MLKNILEKISTRPSKNTYTWNGNKSVIAMMLLHFIWLCRVFSLLQIIKFLRRRLNERNALKKHFNKSDKDVGSKRINITPAFQEWYFIIWLLGILLISLTDKYKAVKNVLEGYYIFESAVWIMYYTVFRRFFEEKYSIYHPLEHFLLILVIVPTQAVAIADIYNTTFRDSLLALIGVGEALPGWVSVLGVIYMALTISIVISNFPIEINKAGRRHLIIGSGDVVANRLLPALMKLNINKKQISVFSLEGGEEICGITVRPVSGEKQQQKLESLTKSISEEATIWIETPSHLHIYYLKTMLSYNPRMIVVEKPATVFYDELEFLKETASGPYRQNIFFLSYYMLEKALPLTYLSRRNSFYERYLEFENKERIIELYHSLGKLKSIYVYIKEGEDNRKWLNEPWSGGHFFETFIHNMLIAAEFAGTPEKWENINLVKNKSQTEGVEKILLDGCSGETEIKLEMVKNDSAYNNRKERGALLIYENGKITADFDEMDATVCSELCNEKARICVKEKYRGKYNIQTDMVGRVFSFGINPSFVDGYKNQPECLNWLIENK